MKKTVIKVENLEKLESTLLRLKEIQLEANQLLKEATEIDLKVTTS